MRTSAGNVSCARSDGPAGGRHRFERDQLGLLRRQKRHAADLARCGFAQPEPELFDLAADMLPAGELFAADAELGDLAFGLFDLLSGFADRAIRFRNLLVQIDVDVQKRRDDTEEECELDDGRESRTESRCGRSGALLRAFLIFPVECS